MGLVDLLWSLGSALFGRGDISSLLAGLLLTGLALVINLYLRRKRLSLREGYNSKVAFVPDLAERSELFKGLLPTIKNVSSLIIRIKNTGRSVIYRGRLPRTGELHLREPIHRRLQSLRAGA